MPPVFARGPLRNRVRSPEEPGERTSRSVRVRGRAKGSTMPIPGRRPEAGTSELSRAPSDTTPVVSLDLVEAMDSEAILGLVDAAPDGDPDGRRARPDPVRQPSDSRSSSGTIAVSCSDARSTTCSPSVCARCTARTGPDTGPSRDCVQWAPASCSSGDGPTARSSRSRSAEPPARRRRTPGRRGRPRRQRAPPCGGGRPRGARGARRHPRRGARPRRRHAAVHLRERGRRSSRSGTAETSCSK